MRQTRRAIATLLVFGVAFTVLIARPWIDTVLDGPAPSTAVSVAIGLALAAGIIMLGARRRTRA